MLTFIVLREFCIYVVDLLLLMINKVSSLQWQWKEVQSNYLIHAPTTRLVPINGQHLALYDRCELDFPSNMQGPFDSFFVGGDTAEVCDIKFSNDGKSMLLTTTNNNIYVLDAYGGEKVRSLGRRGPLFVSLSPFCGCLAFSFQLF